MKLFVRDNRAICPVCSGLITVNKEYYTCIDCGVTYIGIDEGQVECEVIVEKVI